MSHSSNRMPLIDALKAIASQLIVLHHLAAYGPLTEAVQQVAQKPIDWLYDYARIAVQVFLVIGGFLAARGLSPDGQALERSPFSMIWKRYLRLSIPFLSAIALAIICSAIANRWLDDDMVPARASLGQWVAHATLMHGILGIESLSAGVWYIAIDFQLFSLLALLLWAGRRQWIAPAIVLCLAVASLFWFNRDASWDNWAVYFFGSYGLGAAAWWASNRNRLSFWVGVIASVGIAALVLDFRLRIAVALVVALTLAFSRRSGLLERWPESDALAFLGRISFSVFLVHFPVYLVVNAIYARFDLVSPTSAIFGMLLTWGVSIGAATLFHRWIESPAGSQRIAAACGWLTATVWQASCQLVRQGKELLQRLVFGRA